MPLKVPIFCAGALDVPWSTFIFVVVAARAIRYFALAYLGIHYGHQALQFLISNMHLVIAIAIGLAVLAIVILQLFNRRAPARKTSKMNGASARR